MAEAYDEIAQEPAVVTVGEAAERLGRSVDSVRSLIRRGRLTARRGNSGQLLVTIPPGAAVGTAVAGKASDSRDESGDGRDEALAIMRDEAEHWRREAEEARVRAARAEGEASAQRELVAELKRLLEETRRPFWRRWLG